MEAQMRQQAAGPSNRPCVQCFSANPRAKRAYADRRPRRQYTRCESAVAIESSAETASSQFSDQWIEGTLKAAVAEPNSERLRQLHEASIAALQTQRMPTTRNEEYRYTDISALLRKSPQPARGEVEPAAVQRHQLSEEEDTIQLVIVNGRLDREQSRIGELPGGVFIGSLAEAPPDAAERLGSLAEAQGSPFAILNGALSEEVHVIALADAAELDRPVHIIYFTTGGASESSTISNPRLLISLGIRASCQVVEEFAAAGPDDTVFTNAVTEVHLEEAASLNHRYVELESSQAWHMKATLVSQAASSSYSMTETQLGGRLTRHDLSIQQRGPDTETIMRCFLLCGPEQLHDLHSKLRLDHPRGIANQLHKCIVSASSGRGVFDGNVKVQRLAQQTDAAQLSRNLLLAPRATVNVKPNLQIIADDVKCSHGCAVSDLEEDQLFYFRTRGIDDATARKVLVYSFGSEVTQHFRHKKLLDRIQERINSTLSQASIL